MNGHVPSPSTVLPIRKKLAHKLLKRVTPLHENSRLSVLAEHHIAFLQCTRGPYTGAFFALARHVEAQSALSLSVEHYDVHNRDREHVLIHFESEGIRGGGY